MTDFEDRVRVLPARHIEALRWFKEHTGQTVGWPKPLRDGTRLVCMPKGIYKPAWTEYALSVRQSMTSQYPDQTPEDCPDGRWLYRYYQESLNPADRDLEFTNRALLRNQADGIPVGVLIQVKAKPGPQYEVLGLGVVEAWTNGYFPIRELR